MASEVTTPKRPGPPQWLSSTPTRLLLLVLSPVILLLLVLWGLLGRLLTMPARIVAGFGVALAWVLYLCIPNIPVSLLDWPLVATAGLLAMLLLDSAQKWLHVALWVALAAYGIVRASLLDDDGSTARRRLVNTLAVECCVVPLWLFVTKLKLWVAADEATLEAVESKIYQRYLVTEYKVTQVAGLGTIHVPYCGDGTRLPPRNLVLMHGYMAGNAFWAANLQTLAKVFNVYAVEWKGIGRSQRPEFRPKTDQESDAFFVESFEEWRREMQIDRFILCGHSMGGMYSTYYAEKYSQHIEHLILVSPAGVNEGTKTEDMHWFLRFLAKHYITPMSAIRYSGPFGLGLVQWTMSRRIAWTPPSNIIRSGEMDFEHITQYCYHNWALKPSGDRALYTHLRMPGAGAGTRSLDGILTPHAIKVPVTFLYGGGSDWMNSEYGHAVVQRLQRSQHYAAFHLVPLAGHQVFMDNPSGFNQMVIEAVHAHERSVGL